MFLCVILYKDPCKKDLFCSFSFLFNFVMVRTQQEIYCLNRLVSVSTILLATGTTLYGISRT